MYKLQNGWTKERMKKRIKERNTNKRCVSKSTGHCRYELGKNHCAMGVFIPSNHKALKLKQGGAWAVLNQFPELQKKMPLESGGMWSLQEIHDLNSDSTLSLHERLFKWIDENVE